MTPLKAKRIERGVTQTQLARRTGYSQQAISYAERLAGYRSDELLRRAAVALGCSVDELRQGLPTGE